MEKMEFRPAKVLLLFWIVGIFCLSLPLSGLLTLVCIDTVPRLGLFFVLTFLALLVSLSVYAALLFSTIRYEMDERYVVKCSGVLWKKRRLTPLEKITNIDVRQGPFERLLGYGQIWIFTPSTGAQTPDVKLVGIRDPHAFKTMLIDRAEAAKRPAAAPAASSPAAGAPGDVVPLLREIRDSLKAIERALAQTRER